MKYHKNFKEKVFMLLFWYRKCYD